MLQGSVSCVELTPGVVALVEHQWLRARHPGIGVLISEAPEADVGDSCLQSLVDHSAVDLGLKRIIESVNIHFGNRDLHAEGIVGIDHVRDYTWDRGHFGNVHLHGNSVDRDAVCHKSGHQIEQFLTLAGERFNESLVDEELSIGGCYPGDVEGICNVAGTEYVRCKSRSR